MSTHNLKQTVKCFASASYFCSVFYAPWCGKVEGGSLFLVRPSVPRQTWREGRGGVGGEKSKKDPVMKNLHITPPAAARDFEIPPIVRGGGDSSPYAKIPTWLTWINPVFSSSSLSCSGRERQRHRPVRVAPHRHLLGPRHGHTAVLALRMLQGMKDVQKYSNTLLWTKEFCLCYAPYHTSQKPNVSTIAMFFPFFRQPLFFCILIPFEIVFVI